MWEGAGKEGCRLGRVHQNSISPPTPTHAHTHTRLLPHPNAGIVAYSPLARGLLTGAVRGRDALDASDRRHHLPRFEAANASRSASKVERLAEVAAARGCTPAQLALAWLLTKCPFVVPIPGSKTAARVEG